MSANLRTVESTVIKASPAAAAETDVCEVAGVVTRTADGQVYISAELSLTIGTAGVSVTLRLRRGAGTTGTAVATSVANSVTAASKYTFSIAATDSPGLVDSETYTLTVQVGSASAVSTVSQVALRADY